MKKILMLVNHTTFLSVPGGTFTKKFSELVCKTIETPIDRRGTNLIQDFKLLLSCRKNLKQVNPDTVLSYTKKPNIYGGLAGRLSKIPFISNVTGLGTAVKNGGMLQNIVISLYRLAMHHAKCIFFQHKKNKPFFKQTNFTLRLGFTTWLWGVISKSSSLRNIQMRVNGLNYCLLDVLCVTRVSMS